jgi:YVTN family beta-propeller protein
MKPFVHYSRFLLMLVPLVCGIPHLTVADIQATLESPANQQKVTGIGAVAGWAFSTDPQATVVRVKLRIDEQVVGDIAWPGERGDVAATFPTIPQALNSGFASGVNFSDLSSGSHKIGVEITDDRGGSRIIDHEVTVIRVGGFTLLSDLNLVTTEPNIEGRQIKLPFVDVTEKPTDTTSEPRTQQVKLTLGWQADRQALGIVDSENTSDPTQPDNDSDNRSIEGLVSPPRDSRSAEGDTIRANLENPPSGLSTVTGKTLISGWAFSTTAGATVTKIELQVDGTPIQTVPCCTPRPDVVNATDNKDFPQALNSGFATEVNFNDLDTTQVHTLEVVIQTTDDKKTLTLPVTTVGLGNFSFIDQIDLSGAEVLVQSSRTLRIEDLKVEGKDRNGADATRTVTADFSWNEACQCFATLSSCGDGNVAPSTEECDGATLNGASCTSLGFSGGTLSCTPTCAFDTRACTGGQKLYVTNALDNTVSVVDTATYEIANTIKVGSSPRGIAVSPDGTTVYVTNTGDDTLSILNVADNIVNATVKVGKGPQSVVVTPDGTKLYIANGKADAVAVFDVATRKILTNVDVGKKPEGIALTPDGITAYVTNYGDDTVSVIDTRTNAVTATISDKIGKGPSGIAVSPDGTQVYVVNYDGDSISIVDAAQNAVIDDPIKLGLAPIRVTFEPDGTRAYITSVLDFSVIAFDTATKTQINSIPTFTEPDGVIVSARGKRVFVAVFGRNGDEKIVDIISTITNTRIGSIEVGDGPFAVALTPPPKPVTEELTAR